MDHGPGQDRHHRRPPVHPGRAGLVLGGRLAALLALIATSPAIAAPLPDGWRPAVLADIPYVSSPRDTYTPEVLAGKFTARADFDGDGRIDDALVAVRPEGRRFAVYVLTPAPAAVWEGDLDHMPDLSLQVRPAGAYAIRCAPRESCPSIVRIPGPGLEIHQGPGRTILYAWRAGTPESVELLTWD